MKDTPKYPSSKRTGDVGKTTSSKAPKGFKQPERVKVIETITPLPSAKKTIECDAISSKILNEEFFETLPQTYQESEVKPETIKEEKEEYIYQIPEGYEHIQPVVEEKKPVGDYVAELETRLRKLKDTSYESIDKLMKAICIKHAISPKKLHDDFKAKHNVIPDEWIDAQTPKEKPKTAIEKVAESLRFTKKEELTEEEKGDNRDRRIAQLEQELINLRKITLETAQGTIVHGLGAGSPGSGEVRINRMDDVSTPNLQDGDVLVWDAEMQKWIPGTAVGTGASDLFNKINSMEQKILFLMSWIDNHAHSGGGGEVSSTTTLLEVEQSSGTGDDRTFVEIEQSGGTTTYNPAGDIPETSQFTDTIPDGDTTTFMVDINDRGVYTLDGIAQPTVTLPRGDIIEFDLSLLDEPTKFDLYKNGELLPTGRTRFTDTNILRLRTGEVSTDITKVYYKNTEKTGMGWVVVITDS